MTQVFDDPVVELVEDLGEGMAKRGERVFDVGRNGLEVLTGNEAPLFKIAKGLGEDFLGDAVRTA